MHLRELTISGFKSFAKKSELEFSSSITAIVGPNGSGKSNIAEAFRFVLGEQSVKSMRGKRGEDLIWGGSEKIARANRASVSVVFDNRERGFDLDFDEVRIERVVHRDGQNEYKLNDSSVRLKDIHELLAGANIGATGHHIISQGEADRVLTASPRERREMIEDALGLKVYQLKKQETQRKLQKTHENITEVQSLRREAAPHLQYLKRQVEKAERALELQAQLKYTYAEYLKREDVYVAHEHDRLTAERAEPEAALAKVNERLAELAERPTETDRSGPNVELDAAEAALRDAIRERELADRAVSQLEGKAALLRSRIAAAAEATDERLVPRTEVAELIEGASVKADEAVADGTESVMKRALSGISASLRQYLTKDEATTVDPTEADAAELAETKSELEQKGKVAEAAKEAEESCRTTVTDLRTQVAQANESERAAERERFELLDERRELELCLREIDGTLRVLERDRSDFKQQLQEAVALLGRSATEYFQYEVKDDTGAVLDAAAIAAEERSAQRERHRELEKLKIRLEELGVGATEELQREFEDAKARDEFLAGELADLGQSVENLESLIAEMEEKLHEQFSLGIDRINTEFQTFFTLMFGGGAASLERVAVKNQKEDDEDGEEPTEVGVELAVALPNKRVKGLEMLSGGERALTSIALIFAMSQVNPPPFIILDETDAALDEANSRRYGDMIEALAKKSQLVLITHNRETMSRAGILYGITMGGEGVSKVLSVKFAEAAVAK